MENLFGRYGNIKSIKSRIIELINDIRGIFTGIATEDELNNFIQLVVKTIHVLTHPKDPKRKDFKYMKLIIPITRKLEIIVVSYILLETGFKIEQIKDI